MHSHRFLAHPRRRSLAAIVGPAVIALVFLAACGGASDVAIDAGDEPNTAVDGPPTLAGYERAPEPTVGAITLPAANRDTDSFAFKADPGELLMVTFGFTSCPDICPTTLSDARIAFNQLGTRADEVDLAWVSIDPDRDSPAVTTTYVEAFVPDGIALRTDDADELAIAADAFGVTYVFQENDAGEVEVAHTANVYVVDDAGSIILTWPFGVPADDIASDLNILLDRRLDAP